MSDDKDPRAEAAIKAWGSLKADRVHHEKDWEDIHHFIRTQRGGFINADPGKHRDHQPLNASALIAGENMASGIYGTLTNPANRWFEFKMDDDDLNARQDVKAWLEHAADRVHASFANSPFYEASMQLYADVVSFGNAAQYDEVPTGERGVMDVTLSLAGVCVEIDDYGRVNEVARKFRLSAPQAADRFGYDNLPEKLRERAVNGSRDRHEFFHHVVPNRDYEPGALGRRGKPWRSVYASLEGTTLLSSSGFDDMPFYFPRWDVDSEQTYGRGRGFVALPGSRKLELMSAANLRAGQRIADPTWLAPNRGDWPLSGRTSPGAVVYGGLDDQGNQMLRELGQGSGTGLTLEMERAAIEEIRDAFYWTLMQLVGRTGMTATEVLERSEEKLRLMAPHLGRVQIEYLARKVSRRFNLLWRRGQILPPPQDAGGSPMRVKYTSAAALAQRSAEGAAASRLVNDLAPLAAVSREAAERAGDRIDPDGYIEVLHEARGAPARVLRSREDADELGRQRAQAQQAAQGMDALQAGGRLARDLAAAQPAGSA